MYCVRGHAGQQPLREKMDCRLQHRLPLPAQTRSLLYGEAQLYSRHPLVYSGPFPLASAAIAAPQG